MLKNFLRLFLVATFAVAAAVPITASAAGPGGGGGTGMTVVMGTPSKEQAHLLVTVPVTITCTSPLPNGFQGGQIFVSILQVANKTVNYGSGFVSLTSCPTKPTTFKVIVTPGGGPNPALPFHHGIAAASASAGACDPTNTCIAGSDGPRLVHI